MVVGEVVRAVKGHVSAPCVGRGAVEEQAGLRLVIRGESPAHAPASQPDGERLEIGYVVGERKTAEGHANYAQRSKFRYRARDDPLLRGQLDVLPSVLAL